MVWDDHYRNYLDLNVGSQYGLPGYQAPGAASEQLTHATAHDCATLAALLNHPTKKWFVFAIVRQAASIPVCLFEPLMRAAVYEENPSDNKWFVFVCLRVFGTSAVHQVLFRYLLEGSPQEQLGALGALYWARGTPATLETSLTLPPRGVFADDPSSQLALPETWDDDDHASYLAYLAARRHAERVHHEAFRELFRERRTVVQLQAYLRAEDEEVQRTLERMSSFQYEAVPETARELVTQAREKASRRGALPKDKRSDP